MRIMKQLRHDIKYKVVKHIITKNYWEYYVTDLPDADGIGNALVLGFETEWGSFDYNEMKPYIISETTNLDDLLPALGHIWEY